LKIRTVLVLLVLALATFLVACGSSSSSSSSSTSSTTSSTGSAGTTGTAAASSASPSPALTQGTGASSSPAATPAASPVASTPTAKVTGSLTVFAASSLTAAFNDIGKQLEQQSPGTKITFNFAGSPTLRTQLSQGAKADVFASADEPNMQGAEKDGTIAGTPQIFVRNRLVLIVPKSNPAGITTLEDLAKPGIKLVLAEQNVPVGNYARQSFAKMDTNASFGSDFSAKVLKNVVSEETNVKQVVAKVQLGEADAGIVYTTDVTPSVRPDVKMIDIPDQFNIIASYPAAVVKGSSNPTGAAAFIDYLRSPAGQAILQHYGFLPPTAQ